MKPAQVSALVISRSRNLLQSVLFAYSSDGSLVGSGAKIIENYGVAEPLHQGSDASLEIPAKARDLLRTEDEWKASPETGLAIWREMEAEPLRFLAGPLLAQMAEINRCSLALALPDAIHWVLAQGMPTHESALMKLLGQGGMQVMLQEGWMTSRLARQSWLGQTNLDRESLRRFSKHWKAGGLPLLKARARFAYENGEAAWMSDLGLWLSSHVISPIRGSYLFPIMASGSLVRTLGSFSEGQWDSLLKGSAVDVPRSSRLGSLLVRDTFGHKSLASHAGQKLPDMTLNGATAFREGAPAIITIKASIGSDTSVRGGFFGNSPTPLSRAALWVANRVSAPTEAEVQGLLNDPIAWGDSLRLGVTAFHGTDLKAEASIDLEEFHPEAEVVPFSSWMKVRREGFLRLVRQEFAQKDKGGQIQPP